MMVPPESLVGEGRSSSYTGPSWATLFFLQIPVLMSWKTASLAGLECKGLWEHLLWVELWLWASQGEESQPAPEVGHRGG